MPTLQFCVSLIVLLLAPGPTNALLALGGAEAGAWRTLRLLPLVVAAYATVVLPLAALGEDLLRQHHWVQMAVTLAAALWVAWMAVTLWRRPAAGEATTAGLSGKKLFVSMERHGKLLPQQGIERNAGHESVASGRKRPGSATCQPGRG